MNAFEILRLPPRLSIRAEEVNNAFREAGKSMHPDAGGDDREFARLREAHAILSSPSRRLRHWLETHGITVEARGVVAPEVSAGASGVRAALKATSSCSRWDSAIGAGVSATSEQPQTRPQKVCHTPFTRALAWPAPRARTCAVRHGCRGVVAW